jgi:hypothetical protein
MPTPSISNVDPEEWFRARRRQLLTGAGTTAATGVSGCLGEQTGGDVREQTGGEQRDSPTTGHDHGGDHLGASTPVDRIDVRRLSGSRREGDTVYYHPEEPGPYPDGEAALDDVPPGGTFVLGHASYDVATEGRLVREEPINVRGTGWQRDNSDDTPVYRGAVFTNTGDDVIDEPVIDCDTEGGSSAAWALQNTFRDFAVIHEGPSSPAVRLRNYVFNTMADCGVECEGKGAKGVSFEEGGFFTRMHRCQVSSATDVSVHVSGVGYAHEFYSNHIRTTEPDARAALQTERQRTIVVGGEYYGDSTVPAIRFYNPGTQGSESGGLVMEPGFEHAARVEIDGKAPFDNVQLYHTKIAPHRMEDDVAAVTFGRTNNSMLINPVVYANRGKLARWSENARNCGIIAPAETLRGVTYTDEGARNPYVSISGSATPEQLADLPTGVPTTVEYATGQGAPVLNDGDQWYSLVSARSAFAPGE